MPPDGGQPFQHLEPIVDALLRSGNEIAGPAKFYKDRDGWRSDLKHPLDFRLVEERFELPRSIVLSRESDSILDQNTWIEIKGSVTWWDRDRK